MGTVIDQDWQAGRCCQSNKVAAGPLSPSVSQDPASVCPPPVFCEKIPVRESLSCSPPPCQRVEWQHYITQPSSANIGVIYS